MAGQKYKDLIGKTFYSSENDEYLVTEYIGKRYFTITFNDGHTQKCRSDHLSDRSVKNKHHPSVCGIGYVGVGDYKPKIKGRHTREYVAWRNMLKRCYEYDNNPRDFSYEECSVCEEWHNFQNFAKWYSENTYEVPSHISLSIDKDIKMKGNKVYSPDTCLIVPMRINLFFLRWEYNNGNTGIPCVYKRSSGNYKVLVHNAYGGTFTTKEEAIVVRNDLIANMVSELINDYKNIMPKNILEYISHWKDYYEECREVLQNAERDDLIYEY